MTGAVGEVEDDEGHQLRGEVGRGVLRNALHLQGAGAYEQLRRDVGRGVLQNALSGQGAGAFDVVLDLLESARTGRQGCFGACCAENHERNEQGQRCHGCGVLQNALHHQGAGAFGLVLRLEESARTGRRGCFGACCVEKHEHEEPGHRLE